MGVLSSRFPCPSDGAYTTPIDEIWSRFKGKIQVLTESALVRKEQFFPSSCRIKTKGGWTLDIDRMRDL